MGSQAHFPWQRQWALLPEEQEKVDSSSDFTALYLIKDSNFAVIYQNKTQIIDKEWMNPELKAYF